jgi:hypothetical protein
MGQSVRASNNALAVFAAVGAIGAGTAVESAVFAGSPVTFTASCLPGDYAPLDVHCTPSTPLPGDTYRCKDGCFSDSKTSQGACSHHGGINQPLNPGNG